eukprot:TRINITY_DN4222_c0_g1_i2.p1 TRINITY_DN4222_c0_g1~~TRINITY_DN4222_c0_g1_i2.p1  ORF type:complete len:149 (+),score=34.69 TRINITY_DN4222_c0_g1_i2:222-668(+)
MTIRGHDDFINDIIAAFVSSFSIRLEDEVRRKELAVYVFGRSFYYLIGIFVEKMNLPKGCDVLLFGLFGGMLQYAYVNEADIIHHSLYNLIYRYSGTLRVKQAVDTLKRHAYLSSSLVSDDEKKVIEDRFIDLMQQEDEENPVDHGDE